ncbi:hypothetical protein GPECTOR_3g207 [Gonium pectorale]|uniref:Uncharacterized protein n=1 Tax=Gonium pectorale TaxID=33097 RepID=A0A150GZK3_GONPE|nr:hypothetical protein GPECTOR_3g207 [Gonium pectorale]|eukprot:KXZ55048.1 hypothetical protein GPECTOR_3g207 [Gonium pectorale]
MYSLSPKADGWVYNHRLAEGVRTGLPAAAIPYTLSVWGRPAIIGTPHITLAVDEKKGCLYITLPDGGVLAAQR